MISKLRHMKIASILLGPASPSSASETSPLLSSTGRPPTPLPAKQIWVLCLCRFGEPIAFSLIFPFIAQQLWDLGVTDKQEKLGYYAGVIESLFALCSFFTVLGWGRLSDRIGRKPVLQIGLWGVALSISAFGVSKSFAGLVLSRCLGGALNGNVAVIKSMLGELTDETNQGKAFSYLPLAWSIGSVVGPMLGGYLSNPAKHYPSLFGHIPFFVENPYALPCFVGALFPAAGAIVAFLFLEETLTPRTPAGTSTSLPSPPQPALDGLRGRSKYGANVSSTVPVPEEDYPSGTSTPGTSTPSRREGSAEAGAADVKRPPPFKTLFRSKRVLASLLVYACLALETVALDAIFVLFCYSRTDLGGLSFHETQIGKALALGGVCTVSFQLLLFPPLQARFGTTKLYRRLMSLYPLVFVLFPLMSAAAKRDEEDGDTNRKRTWAMMVLFLVIKSIANCSYACNMLTITDSSPSRRLLGTLNGVAQMCSSLCRSFGPMAASSLFAFSKERRWLNGNFVWAVMVGVAVLSASATSLLVDKPAEWREVKTVTTALAEEDDDEPRRAAVT